MPGNCNKHGRSYVRKSIKNRMKNLNSKQVCKKPKLLECDSSEPNISNLQAESERVDSTFDDLPPLVVEKNIANTESPYLVSGRRISDINHLFNQFLEASKHGVMDCGAQYMQIIGEVSYGLISNFKVVCRMCNYTCTISTENEAESKMDINLASTSGAYAIGVGFSGVDELFGAMDIPFMSHNTFNKCEATLRKAVFETAALEMKNAAEEEKQLAIEAGSVDDDGVPLLTVIADGSWAKRSYKSKYDSLSGLAVIVGQQTKKVLYLGVKNKFCSFCSYAEYLKKEPSEHVCSKNWSEGSTAMESAIILEGFKNSEAMYGVRYNKIIADGDSSVYHNLIKNRPYKRTAIIKVECFNHLLRNLCKKIRATTTDKSIGTPYLRRTVLGKIKAIRSAVNQASKHWSGEDVQDRTEKLKRDIKNAPFHIFGRHFNCAQYFCAKQASSDEDIVDMLKAKGMWQKIEDAFKYLSRHSNSLIQRLNSNLAENFNSVVAKFIGGKRINFCKSLNYQTRCLSAVVSANSKALQSRLNKNIFGRSPGIFTKKMERRFALASARNKKKSRTYRSLDYSKSDYGPLAMEPDMDEQSFQKECDDFLASLRVDPQSLEVNTREQSESPLWHEERRKRLTASNFSIICKRRKTTKVQKLIENLLYKGPIRSRYTEYGHISESKAIKHLEDTGINVVKCGLFSDPDYPFLGASPDGLVDEDGIVEVKCPYSLRQLLPVEAVSKSPHFDKNMNLKKNSSYNYQIQGQLAITNRNYCMLVIYTEQAPFIEIKIIQRDREFWEHMREKLMKFYFDCVLPELVDPRKNRSMPIREPYMDIS